MFANILFTTIDFKVSLDLVHAGTLSYQLSQPDFHYSLPLQQEKQKPQTASGARSPSAHWVFRITPVSRYINFFFFFLLSAVTYLLQIKILPYKWEIHYLPRVTHKTMIGIKYKD